MHLRCDILVVKSASQIIFQDQQLILFSEPSYGYTSPLYHHLDRPVEGINNFLHNDEACNNLRLASAYSNAAYVYINEKQASLYYVIDYQIKENAIHVQHYTKLHFSTDLMNGLNQCLNHNAIIQNNTEQAWNLISRYGVFYSNERQHYQNDFLDFRGEDAYRRGTFFRNAHEYNIAANYFFKAYQFYKSSGNNQFVVNQALQEGINALRSAYSNYNDCGFIQVDDLQKITVIPDNQVTESNYQYQSKESSFFVKNKISTYSAYNSQINSIPNAAYIEYKNGYQKEFYYGLDYIASRRSNQFYYQFQYLVKLDNLHNNDNFYFLKNLITTNVEYVKSITNSGYINSIKSDHLLDLENSKYPLYYPENKYHAEHRRLFKHKNLFYFRGEDVFERAICLLKNKRFEEAQLLLSYTILFFAEAYLIFHDKFNAISAQETQQSMQDCVEKISLAIQYRQEAISHFPAISINSNNNNQQSHPGIQLQPSETLLKKEAKPIIEDSLPTTITTFKSSFQPKPTIIQPQPTKSLPKSEMKIQPEPLNQPLPDIITTPKTPPQSKPNTISSQSSESLSQSTVKMQQFMQQQVQSSVETNPNLPQQKSRPIQIAKKEVKKSKLLGKGEFGSVKEGIWQNDRGSVKVAVKKIIKSSNAGGDLQIAIANESKIMWELRFHPNIVKLYGVLEEKQHLVMELLDTSLEEYLNDNKDTFNFKICMTLLLNIIAGVEAFHTNNVFHSDLKWENIFVSLSPLQAKIGDFGAAKYLGDTLKCSFAVGGYNETPNVSTPYMAAPEVLKQNEQKGTQSDIYSLGMIMWEMLYMKRISDCSEYQFTGQTIQIIFQKFKNRVLDLNNPLRPSLTEKMKVPQISEDAENDFKELIPKCLDNDPLKRPTAKMINIYLSTKMSFLESSVDKLKKDFVNNFEHKMILK